MGPRPTSPALTSAVRLEPVTVHEQGGMSAGVVLALLLQTAISGGTYLVAKRGLAEVPVQTLVLWRFILSGAVFAGLLAVLPGSALPPRRAVAGVLLLGLLAGALTWGIGSASCRV